MRAPAEQFLTLRAYGAPPIIVALAAQGAFRGFLDTKTPLYAVGMCMPAHFDKLCNTYFCPYGISRTLAFKCVMFCVTVFY
jgi:hypothetical protein